VATAQPSFPQAVDRRVNICPEFSGRYYRRERTVAKAVCLGPRGQLLLLSHHAITTFAINRCRHCPGTSPAHRLIPLLPDRILGFPISRRRRMRSCVLSFAPDPFRRTPHRSCDGRYPGWSSPSMLPRDDYSYPFPGEGSSRGTMRRSGNRHAVHQASPKYWRFLCP
jgi:hypothetical protein